MIFSKKFLVISAISSLSMASQSYATEYDDIVVTAFRTPVEAKEVGSSVSIIYEDEIENSEARYVSDLLREVPGLAVNRQGPVGTTTQIRVRGAEGNQVLVLIDGVEVNDIASGSEFDFAHLPTDNISRIEILRGAQSAVWGSDAVAGVINIITKKGEGSSSVSAFAGAGSFGTIETGASLSGGNDLYHYSISGLYQDTNGTNISALGDEQDGYENTTLSLKTGITPLDNLSLDYILRTTDASSEIDNFNISNMLVDDDRVSEVEQLYSRAQASLGLFNNSWKHILGSSITSTDRDTFVSEVENNSTQGKKIRFDYQTSLSFHTSAFVNAEHALTLAYDNEKEIFRSSGQATAFGDPNFKRSTQTSGYVGEYRLGIKDQLFLSASIRRDDNTEFPDATTRRFTAAYLLPGSNTRIHAGYGTGVKNPTFTERFGFSVGGFIPFIGNPNLRPERSKGFDIGVEQSFFDERLLFEAVYFKERLEDEINGFVFINGFSASTAVNVDGKSKREGWEFTAKANITDNLNLKAAYTYIDSTEQNVANRQVREIRRPEHIASANLDYNFYQDRGNMNLAVNYNGSQIDTNFSTFNNERLSSFVLVNLGVSYNINQYFTWYGRIDNLLDEEYEEALGFQSSGISGFSGIRFNFAR